MSLWSDLENSEEENEDEVIPREVMCLNIFLRDGIPDCIDSNFMLNFILEFLHQLQDDELMAQILSKIESLVEESIQEHLKDCPHNEDLEWHIQNG